MATIRALENGTRKVNRTTLRALASALKSDPGRVEAFALGKLTYKQFVEASAEKRRAGDAKGRSRALPDSFVIDVVNGTPILGEVTAGGMVESIVFDPGEEPERVPFVYPELKRVYAVRVRGDSMAAEYQPGDVLMVQDVPREDIQDGDDVVIQCDGGRDSASTFKRVFLSDGDKLKLIPLNRAYSQSECRMENVIRVGKVLGAYRPKASGRKG